MSVADGLLKVTAKLKLPPSVIEASSIVTTGALSSSKIVPIAVSVVAPTVPVVLVIATVNVSSNSSIASCVVGTVAVAVVAPAKNVTVTGVVV